MTKRRAKKQTKGSAAVAAPSVDARGLNLRQLAFIDGLFAGLCQTYAYMRAYGEKLKSAKQNAWHLMQVPAVRAEIERRRGALDRKAEATAQRIIEELEAIAFANPLEGGVEVVDGQVVIRESAVIPDQLRRAIAELSQTEHGVKVKFHSKETALRMLGDYRKLFVKKVEVTGANGGAIAVIALPEKAKDRTEWERKYSPATPVTKGK